MTLMEGAEHHFGPFRRRILGRYPAAVGSPGPFGLVLIFGLRFRHALLDRVPPDGVASLKKWSEVVPLGPRGRPPESRFRKSGLANGVSLFF